MIRIDKSTGLKGVDSYIQKHYNALCDNCIFSVEDTVSFLQQKCKVTSNVIIRKLPLIKRSEPGGSILMTLLVNVSLKFQKLVSQICQYFC